MKKILFISLTLVSFNATAQNSITCPASKITTITAGPTFSTLVRVADATCGNGGWVCIAPRNETKLEEITSNRIFSLAVAAKATGENVRVVYNNVTKSSVCPPQFPDVLDFRTFSNN